MTWPTVSQVYALNFLSAPPIPTNLFFLTPTADTAADKTNNLRPMDKPGYIGKITELRISRKNKQVLSSVPLNSSLVQVDNVYYTQYT